MYWTADGLGRAAVEQRQEQYSRRKCAPGYTVLGIEDREEDSYTDRFQVLFFMASSLDASEKVMITSFFFINKRPNEPGPQLLAIAEEAFCK